MPPAQSPDYSLLDRSNGQVSSSGTSTPPIYPASLVDETSWKPKARHAVGQDPLAYYKAFLHTSLPPSDGSTHDLAQDHDGYTCHTKEIAAHDPDVLGGPQQTRARTVPINLAVRLGNRSNVAPLATIIENCSHSTLNSHGSPSSGCRISSLKVVENVTWCCASHAVSRNLDENALHRIREATFQVECPSATADNLGHDCRGSRPVIEAAVPLRLGSPHHSPFPSASFGDTDHDREDRKSKGFFHDVFQSVRAASRTRTRSSSTVHASCIIDSRDGRVNTSESSQKKYPTSQMSNDDIDAPDFAQNLSCAEANNRGITSTQYGPSAHVYPPLPMFPLPQLETKTDLGSETHLLPPRATTRSREQTTSVRLVRQKSRDAAHDDAAAVLSNEGRHDMSAPYTSNCVSVSRNNVTSSMEYDCGIEFSRDASSCSTLSTAYSGTVLGVDLDLHYGLGRDSTLPTSVEPVWFTPQMAELERQASFEESPDSKQVSATDVPRRSITSSALSSLLPIAAASGIVRPNYNTPKISFYSPSGNLIQPECSMTPDMSAADIECSSISTTAYHNKRTNLYNALSPVRPSIVPLTTPPTSSAPLPAHLRHHHNYRHPEKPQVNSSESFIVPNRAVKGCDGVVRHDSYSPRGGVGLPHVETPLASRHKYHFARTLVDDLRSEANFCKARIVTLVTGWSTRKGTKLKKRCVINKESAAAYTGTRANEAQGLSADNTAATIAGTGQSWRSRRRRRQAKPESVSGFWGPLTGHALRICFCQPYDGAGKRTRNIATGGGACCTMLSCTTLATDRGKRGQQQQQQQQQQAGDQGMNTDVDTAEDLLIARKVDHVNKEKLSATAATAARKKIQHARSL